MKRDNINYLIVGTFVLGLFAVLLIVIYQLTGRSGPSDSYIVAYDNVGGIKFGTPVLYEGYQVGQVEAVKPLRSDNGMRYQLTLSVIRDWHIPSDSIAKVIASGLLSAMTIEIEEGNSDVMLEPGSEIEGREAVSLFTAVNDVAADFKQLSDGSLRPLLDNLAVNINRLTDELVQLTRDDIRPVFNNLEQKLNETEIVDQTNQLIRKLNRSAASLEQIFSQPNQQHVAMTLGNLETASANLNTLLTNIEQTRVNMDEVLASVDGLVDDNKQDLQTSVSQLRAALETIAANIDAITYHLEGSSRNMHEFSRHLRANPGALLRNSAPADAATVKEE